MITYVLNVCEKYIVHNKEELKKTDETFCFRQKKTNELGSIKTPKVDFEFSAAYRVFKHAL